MSAFADQSDYDKARRDQAFFRVAIENCLNGKVHELSQHFDEYSRHNPNIPLEDLIASFSSEGRTLFHVAASSGHPEVLEFLLSKCNPNSRRTIVNAPDDKGFTPLINATISESYLMMNRLISLGADVNARNKDGATAAHYAAADGSVDRLELLITAGATIELSTQSGTPLHWAAGKGQTKAIRYLVERGCNVNALSATQLPAVLMAAVAGSDEAVEYLVDAGADVGHIVTNNITLLHICAEYGLRRAVSAILNTDTGKRSCKIETNEGNLPVHLAAMSGHREIVEMLLSESFVEAVPELDAIMADGARRLKVYEEQQKVDEAAKQVAAAAHPSAEAPPLETTTPAVNVEAVRDAEAHKELGNNAFKKKDYDTAIQEYSAAIRLHGDNAALWSNRSACYLAMGKKERALADAEVCRRLKPDWPKGCYRLAVARLSLGMYEDAVLAAFEGCKLDGTNKELRDIAQQALKLGQEEHRRKVAEGK